MKCHKMPSGKMMSGLRHSLSSKPVKKCECKSKGMKAGSCKKSASVKVKQMSDTKKRIIKKY